MMRKKSVAGILWLLSVIFTLQVKAQASQPEIKPMRLNITFEKTTNLIFPYAVKSVDKGSKDVLAQIAGGVENILQVKAAKQGFTETNLTVVTADGKLYSFLLSYTLSNPDLNIRLDNHARTLKPDALFAVSTDNDARIQDLAEQVAVKKGILNKKDKNSGMSLGLTGIYIHGDMLYFQLQLENNSQINYDISQLRFFIRDNNQAKRTAVQEQQLQPVQYAGNTRLIRGNTAQTIVVVLPKFTIPDKKHLGIQLMEQNGGRNLSMDIKNNILVKARSI
ncbi:conjugative transposon protein TraN [Taibaiella koreensis]|uniref:conjugative transposon protein TraN n=1 Tax=Taibaiella koreensis TaxID=1268548 RepID=UPI000E59ABB1|nr:conjugative transposon protein TraN [Taibaiella koreensis]